MRSALELEPITVRGFAVLDLLGDIDHLIERLEAAECYWDYPGIPDFGCECC